MKFIKRIIVLSLMVLLTVNLATAQKGERKGEAKDPTAHAKKHTERLTEKLSLNPAQVTQVSKINMDFAEKRKEARANDTDRETMKAMRTEQKAAIKAVLTTEQVAKFDAMKGRKGHGKKGKGRKGKKGEKMANKDPQARAQRHTERLTKELNLNDLQVTQVAKINSDFSEKMSAIRANATDKDAAKSTMKSLRTEQKAAIKTVLTPEQITKFDAMKGRKGHGKRGKGKRGDRENKAQ